MLIKFHKIKHFWENSENAKWLNSSDFDKNIFEEIKQDYVYLTSNKPKYKLINKKYVFFFYEEKKDVYNRKITELVAFLSPKSTINNPEKVYADIQSQTQVFSRELDIFIETDAKLNKYNLGYIVSIIFIFISNLWNEAKKIGTNQRKLF